MKTLHIDNLGSVAHALVNELRKKGHDALLIGIYNPRESKCDIEIRPKGDMSNPSVRRNAVLREFLAVKKHIKNYDIIHIHGGVGTTGLYYKFKKVFSKKKIVIHFHGTDLRENVNTVHWDAADLLLVSTPDLLSFSENVGGRRLVHLPNPIDPNMFKPVDMRKKPPLLDLDRIAISHLPSERGIKGTENIVKVIDTLKKDYPVELQIIENLERKKALKKMARSDICIDWVSKKYDIYGMVSIEAMAQGIPTITRFDPEYYDPPIQNTEPETLKKNLERLIVKDELYKKLSAEGPKYIKKVHSTSRVTDKLIKLYENI